jgi:UDP-N-acetylglucosamine--N-acetylmuramyl-(pentapeptide) pyrophosphoryl-undecaprenol N-acetylglucosamine transferase
VYPLLAVVEALKREPDPAEILYIGSPGGIEESIVARAGLPYQSVEAGQIRGVAPWTLWRNIGRLWHGYLQVKSLLADWAADVVLVTGGYVSVPVSLAARRSQIPLMICLPDLVPGWAIRFLSRLADRIAVSFAEVRSAFPSAHRHKVRVSGYPVRAALLGANRSASYKVLRLDPALKTLLVMGGSRGARALNQALDPLLPELLARYQVIHISGQLDWPRVSTRHSELPAELRRHYCASPYMHEELSAAMVVADLAVARAGASTMAEFPAVGLPSILVPYPYAGQHQGLNADFMVAHGAAVRIDDADLGERLQPTVTRLLEDDQTLEQMGKATRALSRPGAARTIAQELRDLARTREG